MLPTPATSSANGFTNDETSLDLENGVVTPILNDLLGGSGGVENPKEDINSSIASLLSNTQTLQQLLGSLTPEQSPTLLVPPTSSMAPHPTLIASPPIFQTPPTDPLMSFLRPPEYLSHVEPPPPPFLFAPPRLNPPSQHQPLMGTVFTQAGAPLPPRIYSPIYLSRNLTAPHPQPIVPFQLGVGGGAGGGFSTPVAQKRKSNHFLPSPEPSPENGYVGQHSQGIGGHYADSYKKKRH